MAQFRFPPDLNGAPRARMRVPIEAALALPCPRAQPAQRRSSTRHNKPFRSNLHGATTITITAATPLSEQLLRKVRREPLQVAGAARQHAPQLLLAVRRRRAEDKREAVGLRRLEPRRHERRRLDEHRDAVALGAQHPAAHAHERADVDGAPELHALDGLEGGARPGEEVARRKRELKGAAHEEAAKDAAVKVACWALGDVVVCSSLFGRWLDG